MPRFAASCVSQVLFFSVRLFVRVLVCVPVHVCGCVIPACECVYISVRMRTHNPVSFCCRRLLFSLPRPLAFPGAGNSLLVLLHATAVSLAVMRAPAFFSIYAVSSLFEIRENRERGE